MPRTGYTPSRRPEDESQLKAELLRNAAFVAYEGRKARALSAWLRESSERRVVYVFDTDVIVAHCAPWMKGPADNDSLGQGYGQILPLKPLHTYTVNERPQIRADERRYAEAVCWLLSSKALRSAMDRRMPILQAKPHFDEMLNVYEQVKSNATTDAAVTRASAQDRRDRLAAHMLRFVSQAVGDGRWDLDGNPGQFLSTILNRMQMLNLQQANSFVREWDGFLDIFRQSGGIFDVAEFSPDEEDLSRQQLEAWNEMRTLITGDPNATSPERTELSAVFQEVIAPKHFQFRRDQLHVDSRALEILATCNAVLERSGVETLKIVLITGDRKATLALAAAKEALPGNSNRTVSDFAFAHVHHLWSFVDEFDAGMVSSHASSSRSQLFSGLLAFEEDEERGPSYTDRLVECAIGGEPQLVKHIHMHDINQSYVRWDDYSEKAANLHRHFLVDPVKLNKISEILVKKFQQQGLNLEAGRLEAMVVETMARARDRTNVQFSEIGANSILEAHRRGIRNPPDLMFDSLETTNKIFSDLALPRRIFMNASDFATRFEQIALDCYQPSGANPADDDFRQECYVKYLVLGSLFASANRWIVAEQHAESAVSIIKRAAILKDSIKTSWSEARQPPNMSGREAQFLLAMAKRIRARDDAGFEQAEGVLKQAIACLLEDQRAGTASGIPSVRFDCEYLALSLARYYYSRSCDQASPCNDRADEVFRRARGLRDAFISQPGRVLDGIEALPASTRTTIATNLLQTVVIARFRQINGYQGVESSPIGRNELRAALEILKQDTDLKSTIARLIHPNIIEPTQNTAEIICSPLMMLYGIVGALMADDPSVWRPQTMEEVDRIFQMQNAIITSYDEWRFKMLQSFTKRLLQDAP